MGLGLLGVGRWPSVLADWPRGTLEYDAVPAAGTCLKGDLQRDTRLDPDCLGETLSAHIEARGDKATLVLILHSGIEL